VNRKHVKTAPCKDSPAPDAALARLFDAQRRSLWALAYRLTGSAEDAEDVVQEAFVRLLSDPPDAPFDELGRWLARVVTNLGLDSLRRRRRRPYVGPWLPSPLPTSETDPLEELVSSVPDPERRYEIAESVSLAFLLALEALSPRQRAVLLFRDVLGYSARETAERVGATEGSVRVAHLRARRALEPYEAARSVPTPDLVARHRSVLEQFLASLLAQDARALEALLADAVETRTDAAGEYTALAVPLAGRSRVARLYLVAARNRQEVGLRTELRVVNGLPAAWLTLAHPVRNQAPRTLIQLELDAEDRIHRIHTVLASRKLAALPA
jgi:RNA polymerase sigma-70 factor (ECF subfamily)